MSSASVGKTRRWLAKFSPDYKYATRRMRRTRRSKSGETTAVPTDKRVIAPDRMSGDKQTEAMRREQIDAMRRNGEAKLSREMQRHRMRHSQASKLEGARVFRFGPERTEFPRKSYGPWSNNQRKRERALTNEEIVTKKMKSGMESKQSAPDVVDAV